MLYTAISVLHVCICLLLVLLVLLQQGKGADAGATFGGGSNTLFGAGGADTFLTKATTILAFLFMTTSFTLALNAMPVSEGKATSKLFQNLAQEKVQKPDEPAVTVSSVGSAPSSEVASQVSSILPVEPVKPTVAPVSTAPAEGVDGVKK